MKSCNLLLAGIVCCSLSLGIGFVGCGDNGGEDGVNTAATVNDFVGIWKGNVDSGGYIFDALYLTITLLKSGDTLNGTAVAEIKARADTFHLTGTGPVVNGQYTYDMSVGDLEVDNPACANWDVTCTAVLTVSNRIMTGECYGITCGQEEEGESPVLKYTTSKQFPLIWTPE